MGKRVTRARERAASIQARLAAAQLKPVKLRVVASLLHHELGRGRRATMRGPQYMLQLNQAARALARVVDVYRLSSKGVMTLIPRTVLDSGELIDGGNVLRTGDGKVLYPLALRRGEAIRALTSLVDAPRGTEPARESS